MVLCHVTGRILQLPLSFGLKLCINIWNVNIVKFSMMTSKEQPDLVGTKENRKSIKEAFHAKDGKKHILSTTT